VLGLLVSREGSVAPCNRHIASLARLTPRRPFGAETVGIGGYRAASGAVSGMTVIRSSPPGKRDWGSGGASPALCMVRRGSGVRVPASASTKDLQSVSFAQSATPARGARRGRRRSWGRNWGRLGRTSRSRRRAKELIASRRCSPGRHSSLAFLRDRRTKIATPPEPVACPVTGGAAQISEHAAGARVLSRRPRRNAAAPRQGTDVGAVLRGRLSCHSTCWNQCTRT
jgi:hypothetical protein